MDAPVLAPPFAPIPRLGLGTWPMRGAACRAAVEGALSLGYRHLDTAEMYGNEDAIGEALRATAVPREEVFLVTKAWWDKTGGDAIRRACEASLRRLRQPHVDLYLIHWPSPALDLPDALRALARLQADGLARHVGVANFPAGLLRRAVESDIVRLACVQVEHHLLLSQARLIAYATPLGIALTSYTPVAKGEVARLPRSSASPRSTGRRRRRWRWPGCWRFRASPPSPRARPARGRRRTWPRCRSGSMPRTWPRWRRCRRTGGWWTRASRPTGTPEPPARDALPALA